MVIGSRQKYLDESYDEMNINLESQVISRVDHAISVGLIIGDRLSCSHHFNEMFV